MRRLIYFASVLLICSSVHASEQSFLRLREHALHREFIEIDDINKQDENGRTPLHLAIIARKDSVELRVVEAFLKAGAKAFIDDKNKRTPLHYAAELGYAAVVTLLLCFDRKAVSMFDIADMTPLSLATLNGHVEVVALLSACMESFIPDSDGMTPLHYAAQEGHSDCIKLLINNNPSQINMPNKQGYTPLHFAIFRCKFPVVEYLIEKGCNPLVVDKAGQTLLHYVAMQGSSLTDYFKTLSLCEKEKNAMDMQRAAIISLLLRYGVDPNVIEPSEKRTLLHYAAINGCLASVDALLKGGAEVNVQDQELVTPLHLASRYGQSAVVPRLLAAGALAAWDIHIKTPWHYAAENGRMSIVTALLEKFPQYREAEDAKGMTALFAAVSARRYPIVKQLVKLGLSVRAVDEQGRVPLHYAVAMGDEKMMRILTCRSLDCITAHDNDGMTPLEYACRKRGSSAGQREYLDKCMRSLAITPYYQILTIFLGLNSRVGADSPLQLLASIQHLGHFAGNPVLYKIAKFINNCLN